MVGEAPAQRIMPVGSKEECLPVDYLHQESGSVTCTADGNFEVASGEQFYN